MLGFEYQRNAHSGAVHYALEGADSPAEFFVSDMRWAKRKYRKQYKSPFYVAPCGADRFGDLTVGANSVDGVLRFIINRRAHPERRKAYHDR